MKRLLAFLMCVWMVLCLCLQTAGAVEGVIPVSDDGSGDSVHTGTAEFEIAARAAVLMDAATGTVLYAQNAEEALPPASVTKVMTLLLVMEAIRDGKIAWQDTVTVSEHAASMGGSQIFLKVGEQMTVEDLVKSVVIASANDAAVALAEHIAGSEEAFVTAMNRRATELGMTSTKFENTNGLDDTVEQHLTSALDIAVMSRELMQYPKILEYSATWMDTIRDGAFTLTNTNRLVRFYPGATGLKTGSTAKAKFCISATAEREGTALIAVIMGAESRDVRNAEAKKLLDWGFANFGMYRDECKPTSPIVTGGVKDTLALRADSFAAVLPKESIGAVKVKITLPDTVAAPVREGDVVGSVCYTLDGKTLGTASIYAAESIQKISFMEIVHRMLAVFVIS